MKVLYHYHSPDTQGLKVEGGKVILYAYKPSIVHPGEIIKVPTNTSLKTEEGYYLCLTTYWTLIQKACQMFPALMIVDDKASDKPLDIPIMNCGRNPVNIMPGQQLACGRVVADVPLEVAVFLPEQEPEKLNTKSTPQKKNVGVKFEIK